MALVHVEAVRNAVAELVTDLLDGGSLLFQTVADAEVALLGFDATAFGPAADGIVVANAITPDTSAAGGIAAKFRALDDADDEVFQGTVGTVGSDINGTSVTIAPGDTVSIEAGDLSYEAMP